VATEFAARGFAETVGLEPTNKARRRIDRQFKNALDDWCSSVTDLSTRSKGHPATKLLDQLVSPGKQ
jgi:hypothetical protein